MEQSEKETERQLLLIINPISGLGSKEGIEPLVRKSLEPLGYRLAIALTSGRGDATRLALEAVDAGFYGVLAAGGDGTVNEVARALCHTPTVLGILPCGSGNGLARHLGIPVDPVAAVRIIAEGHVTDSDFGAVNGRQFFCTFGVGFDAAVSYKFARQHRRGPLSYLRSAIAEYVKYNPQEYTVSANGHVLTERAFLIAACNASQYGNNAYIAPYASITDGELDITIIHAGNPLDTAMVGMDLFTGYINKNTLIDSFRAPAAIIRRQQPGQVHIDGEPLAMDDTLDIRCHPAGLRIFTPEQVTSFRPIITPIENAARDILCSVTRLFNRKPL